MVYFTEFNFNDHELAERLERKAEEIAPQSQKRISKMLFTIENIVKNFVPRGQHCQGKGKGGTTKSAIKHQLTESGGEVYADENTAPWFKWFHDGRGPIVAGTSATYMGKYIGKSGKNHGFLHFCIYGKHIFVRSVRASKANPVMVKGGEKGFKDIKPQVESFAQWLTEL